MKDEFIARWRKYFGPAELPLAFFYADSPVGAVPAERPGAHRCVIGDLARVRRGEDVSFDEASLGCTGGRRYFGFSADLMPNFEHFLSCGIPGKMEGERYRKTPELVRQLMASAEPFRAPGRFLVWKRWDRLGEEDRPEAAVFFAAPDVLSGLFTLSGFAEADAGGVIAPFAAGCASIVQHPWLEGRRERPRSVLGMFDVSARPCVEAGVLTFAVPMAKFRGMVADMDESFLITRSWEKVRGRITGREAASP